MQLVMVIEVMIDDNTEYLLLAEDFMVVCVVIIGPPLPGIVEP
jgi:hypothetical protein